MSTIQSIGSHPGSHPGSSSRAGSAVDSTAPLAGHSAPSAGFRSPAGTIIVPLDLLDKLDVTRYNPVKTFGNPAPVALAGLVMCLTPLACQLIGWASADPSGHANNGAHVFCGGLLLLIGGLLEFFIGNTFSFVVFCSYGGFFFALGATMMPVFNATPPYLMENGHLNADFYNSFGFFHVFIGVLSLLFLICSTRINIVLVILFAAYTVAFTVLAVADWQRAVHNDLVVEALEITAGASCFIVSLCGWYALAESLFKVVNLPVTLPMGDLSGITVGSRTSSRARTMTMD